MVALWQRGGGVTALCLERSFRRVKTPAWLEWGLLVSRANQKPARLVQQTGLHGLLTASVRFPCQAVGERAPSACSSGGRRGCCLYFTHPRGAAEGGCCRPSGCTFRPEQLRDPARISDAVFGEVYQQSGGTSLMPCKKDVRPLSTFLFQTNNYGSQDNFLN